MAAFSGLHMQIGGGAMPRAVERFQEKYPGGTILKVPGKPRQGPLVGGPYPARKIRRTRCAEIACVVALFFAPLHAGAQSLQRLGDLSIEELSQIEITSVSKRSEPLSDAPAAIFVMTGVDIRRSGATSLADALRLAPYLEVARVDSQPYNIS
jgi:hypothetical protein